MATPWTDLRDQVLADLAAGDVLKKSYTYSTGSTSRTISFHDLDKVTDFLKFLNPLADAESSTTGRRRSYAQFNRPGAGV